jgi:hypothetical protein
MITRVNSAFSEQERLEAMQLLGADTNAALRTGRPHLVTRKAGHQGACTI